MKTNLLNWPEIEKLVDEVILVQRKHLLDCGRRIVPTLTPEDILQPNDYEELEQHPHFRYEEGLLAGMQTVQMALRACQREAQKA